MERDIALRLDSMLLAVCGNLDMITHYMKNNLSDKEYKQFIYNIGNSMAELAEISNALHRSFPDIIPKELQSQN